MSIPNPTGGCQCGAVRFEVTQGFGRASICHCRMCQRAFGNAFAPLVTAHGLRWTQGQPKYFQSSNKVRRGFCGECGTPLTYEPETSPPEIAFFALDDPGLLTPAAQTAVEHRQPWVLRIAEIPVRKLADTPENAAFFEGLVSYQHRPPQSR